MNPEWLHFINIIAWQVSNGLITYISIALVIFVVGYYVLFDPKATTVGRYLFRFVLSLVLVIGLSIVTLYFGPSSQNRVPGFEPDDAFWWLQILRLIVFSYVAYTVTGLAFLLGIRKFRPDLIKTMADHVMVQPRRSNTGPTDIQFSRKEI